VVRWFTKHARSANDPRKRGVRQVHAATPVHRLEQRHVLRVDALYSDASRAIRFDSSWNCHGEMSSDMSTF